jgi:hypothetical protein
MPFEELDLTFMLPGRVPSLEGAEVTPLAGLWILLAGIETIFTGFQLPNHMSSIDFVILG